MKTFLLGLVFSLPSTAKWAVAVPTRRKEVETSEIIQ
jgi:hypothetical protein